MKITYEFHIIEGEIKMKILVDDSKPGEKCYLYAESGNINKPPFWFNAQCLPEREFRP